MRFRVVAELFRFPGPPMYGFKGDPGVRARRGVTAAVPVAAAVLALVLAGAGLAVDRFDADH
ncbi:hypothetical protein, partial [Spongiactinospora gelatinilytica]|uniref:hypothetical protein n=1 Tax=Spongiactinospora gelatinilytica TaxID=2666298 RepID=UPI0011B947D1